MITLPILLAASVTPLLHSLLIFLVAFLVALVVFWAISKFVTDATIRSVFGVIIALILLLFAISLFFPNL